MVVALIVDRSAPIIIPLYVFKIFLPTASPLFASGPSPTSQSVALKVLPLLNSPASVAMAFISALLVVTFPVVGLYIPSGALSPSSRRAWIEMG